MVNRIRSARIDIRCLPREAEMLRELADYQGRTQSDVLRQLVRQAHADVFGPPTAAEQEETQATLTQESATAVLEHPVA